MELGLTYDGLHRGYLRGHSDALKAVRRAVGKCGIPSALVKLLRPIR